MVEFELLAIMMLRLFPEKVSLRLVQNAPECCFVLRQLLSGISSLSLFTRNQASSAVVVDVGSSDADADAGKVSLTALAGLTGVLNGSCSLFYIGLLSTTTLDRRWIRAAFAADCVLSRIQALGQGKLK